MTLCSNDTLCKCSKTQSTTTTQYAKYAKSIESDAKDYIADLAVSSVVALSTMLEAMQLYGSTLSMQLLGKIMELKYRRFHMKITRYNFLLKEHLPTTRISYATGAGVVINCCEVRCHLTAAALWLHLSRRHCSIET